MSGTQPGQILVGRYRLDERVPSDLADVEAWSARDVALDRMVRISLLTGSRIGEAMDATRRAALVTDPRLPKIFDVGSEDGRDYIVSEPYDGQSLAEIVSQGIVDPQQARAVIGEAATVLEIAADRGVHHLALRPESIRVEGSRVLVTGLGLDAGLAGLGRIDADVASRADAMGLVALLYYTMTARWAGPSLDVEWIDPNAVHPLPVHRGNGGVERLDSARQDGPKDLADLCAASFAGSTGSAAEWGEPPGDTPAKPGAVVGALRPWERISVVAALPAFVPAAEPSAPITRQSVRSVFTAETERPPGTPPPARPVHASLARAIPVAAGTVPSAGAPLPVVTASPAGGSPAGGSGPFPSGPPQTPTNKVDGSRVTVVVVVALVVVALIWSAANLFGGFGPVFSSDGKKPQTVATTTGTGGGSAAPTRSTGGKEVRPVIASGESLDPQGKAKGDAKGEHEELVENAYDSDPSTVWMTRSYKTPKFGNLKDGVGFAVTLETAAPVSSIVVMTDCKDGNIQVRATSADKPTSGPVLARGTFVQGQTELTFDKPVTATTFVLWFDTLPIAPDGKYRVDISEIILS